MWMKQTSLLFKNEKKFWRQKGRNPSAVQFRRSFRKLFLLTYEYIHTKHMNCCDDFAVILTSLSDFNDSKPRALIINSLVR
jgi:hypothetical protein